jgi:uncharacterized membrane protein HdeD (DUF308 family)
MHFIGIGLLDHPFFAKMQRPFDRQLGGRRFHFFHGHETDPFNNSDDPGFGQMLSIFAGLLEDHNGSPLLASGETMEALLEEFGESMLALWTAVTAGVSAKTELSGEIQPRHALTPVQNPNRLAEHIESIRAARKREGWDVAVLGHTHKFGHVGDWYYNSGSWVGSRNLFLRIDPEGHVRYFEWKNGLPIESEAPVVQSESEGEAEKNPLKKAKASIHRLFPRPTRPEKSRLLLMGRGALALSLGLWAISLSFAHGQSPALFFLVTIFALYALVNGVLALLGAPRQQPIKRVIDRMLGSLSILLGLVFLTHRESLEVFAVLVGVWALLAGGLRLGAAKLLRHTVEARWLRLVGWGSVLAGLILLFLPASAVLLAKVIAGYLCFMGGGELLAGIFGKRQGGRSWQARSLLGRKVA